MSLIWISCVESEFEVKSEVKNPETKAYLQRDVILVVLFEDVGGCLVVAAHGSCFPAAVVAAGVALVKLKAATLLPTRQHSMLLCCLRRNRFWCRSEQKALPSAAVNVDVLCQ